MERIYNPTLVEEAIYQSWEKEGYFRSDSSTSEEPYSVVIPPPNITGGLHMGHAFQCTIMDILVRCQRMRGKNTLWQVGTDHAGIATQMVVERMMEAEEGKTKSDYGREAFVKKVQGWKSSSCHNITTQLRRLGASVDWRRERFTMDEKFYATVQEAFIRLYKEGLIYRGRRLVNWDPKLHTAVSDLEVENKEDKGWMWFFRYPLAGGAKTVAGKDYIVVATTRPETILGDAGVAVNPGDFRYKNLVGKEVLLPITNRRIPVVEDKYADEEKGTGCVKITPGHDGNDYAVGQRHGLPIISIFNRDATIRDKAEVTFVKDGRETRIDSVIPKKYRGLERFTARKLIVEELDELGLLEKVEEHRLIVPYGDRSGAVIEPMLTHQWYIRIAPLAEPAVRAVESGSIRFVPKQYENMYFSWMRDIQDWCISRQIWWGHRIPVWYDPQGNTYVDRNEVAVRRKNKISDDVVLRQESDVLDTWFSSSLWVLGTLGWPEKTPDLDVYYPSSVLVTGFDIIFFWVARMIMMSMYFMKNTNGQPQVPFKTVYVTGLLRDKNGSKISKSRGNALDPIDVIEGIDIDSLVSKLTSNMMQPKLAAKVTEDTRKTFGKGIEPYGTDALRLTLSASASMGRDINWDTKRLEGCRNFCNKLWNASYYVLKNVEHQGYDLTIGGELDYSLADKWIESQFQLAAKNFNNHIDNFRFDMVANVLYEFIWNQFCDWYIELTKPVFREGNEAQRRATCLTLVTVLEKILRLAHPVIPYITEAIWKNVSRLLLGKFERNTITLQALPQYEEDNFHQGSIDSIEWVKAFIIGVRNLRAEHHIGPGKPLEVILIPGCNEHEKIFSENRLVLVSLAKLRSARILTKGETISFFASVMASGSEIIMPMAGVVERKAEKRRLEKAISKAKSEVSFYKRKLDNKAFLEKAPEPIVARERSKLKKYQKDLTRLEDKKATIDIAQHTVK